MSGDNKFNVLLITADQFRADCLSAVGHPLIKTPALDALAEDGVLFTNHYGQCPPCGPSRTSLLTGMYQMNHRSVQNGSPLDAGFTNLAMEVRSVGMEPWLIGYTDTAMDPRRIHPNDPRARRYEEILPGMMPFAPGSEWGTGDTDWRYHLKELGYDCWDDPYRQKENYLGAERGPSFSPVHLKAEHSDTAYTTDRAIRFVGQNRRSPWFLHVSFLRPHPPFVAPEPWHDLYKPDDVPDFEALPSLEDEKALHPYMPYRLERLEMDPELPFDRAPNDNPAWRQAKATYYGLISELDANIGRLIQALKDSGEYERTLIVFTSDHGEMLGDHWCWGKELPFDKSVRVPFIVRSPLISETARGRQVTRFTEHVDIMPTILDHLGIEVPLQCDGYSVRAFLEGGEPARWRDEAHWEYDFRNVFTGAPEQAFGITIDECGLAVLRTATRKYVHFASLPPLYFNLENDPAELRNLAGDPGAAAEMLEMAQRMLSWRMVYNRRELAGIWLKSGRHEEAARSRRIA